MITVVSGFRIWSVIANILDFDLMLIPSPMIFFPLSKFPFIMFFHPYYIMYLAHAYSRQASDQYNNFQMQKRTYLLLVSPHQYIALRTPSHPSTCFFLSRWIFLETIHLGSFMSYFCCCMPKIQLHQARSSCSGFLI